MEGLIRLEYLEELNQLEFIGKSAQKLLKEITLEDIQKHLYFIKELVSKDRWTGVRLATFFTNWNIYYNVRKWAKNQLTLCSFPREGKIDYLFTNTFFRATFGEDPIHIDNLQISSLDERDISYHSSQIKGITNLLLFQENPFENLKAYEHLYIFNQRF